jgi:hypothetical protein
MTFELITLNAPAAQRIELGIYNFKFRSEKTDQKII